MSNLFNEDIPQIDPEKDYFSELVGEGKKFRDEKALALSKVHADMTIEQLKAQLAESQSELQTRTRMEELLTKVTESREKSVEPPPVNHDQTRNEVVNDLTAEKIESLISERLNQHERNRSASENIRAVKQALTEQYGNNYEEVLRRVTQETGVSNEWLQKTAQENPKLVLSLVKANAPRKEASVSPPATRLNPEIAPQTDERTWAYYQKLKSRDPKYYESKEVQAQMHKDAVRLQERFFVTN